MYPSTHLVRRARARSITSLQTCTDGRQRYSSKYVSAKVGCYEQVRAKEGTRWRRGSWLTIPARIDAAATQNPAFVAVASKFTSAAGDGRAAEDGPGARLRQQHLLRRGRPEGGLIEESPIVAFLIALRADGWAEGCYDLFWLWSL